MNDRGVCCTALATPGLLITSCFRTKALHKEKEEMTTDVLGAAREVLAQGESLEAQEKTEVNDEKDKPVEEAEMSRR